MDPPKINNSEVRAEPAARKTYQSIKLGLDVHADSLVVVRILDHSTPQPAQRFSPAKFRQWVQTQLPLAAAVHSCYEAGPIGYGRHRELVALGIRNVVVQPVCLDERHTGVNHDPSDARELALRRDRYAAGNGAALAPVRVPTPVEEPKRIASRQREQLKREVARLAAQGRSLLLTQGYREKRGWWSLRRWMELHAKLPAWLTERLEVFRRLLATLTAELAAATAALAAPAPGGRPKGLGGLTYAVVEREVGDWHRFVNRRQLLAIPQHGNVRLRTALVELAWRMVRWQPDCPLITKWRAALFEPKTTRARRKKAVVAIARQRAVDLWRWRTGRVQPETLGWQMIGV